VNGHSSFAPPAYEKLYALLHHYPVADSVWDAMAGLRTSLLVYHTHEGEPLERSRYRRLVRRGVEEEKLALLASFSHGEGRDFVFRLGSTLAPPEARGPTAEAELARFFAIPEGDFAPPFGVIHVPSDGQRVPAGFWGFGWALDDSGIAEIRIGTELGPGGIAMLGGLWPSLASAFPDYADAEHGGYGFVVPDVPPGPHTLTVTLIAKDGGRTVLKRPIVVVRPEAGSASPTPAR
jgi:hypothetical protein